MKNIYIILKIWLIWLRNQTQVELVVVEKVFHYKKINLSAFQRNIKIIKNIQISEKQFKYFTSPEQKQSLRFSSELKKNNKIKNVSFEMISNNIHLN